MQIIDTHNHSLPGIDDGAKDLKMALAMLNIAEANGTTDIILTPHHLNGAFLNFTQRINEKTYELQKQAKKNNIKVKLHVGSEVHLVPETVEHLVEQKALTYCGLGKAALIELPKHSIPVGAENILSKLIYSGITPIIAHPERNSILRKDFGRLKEWITFGCKSQVTGQSCSGSFGNEMQKTTLKMIADGLVHLVASDAHRPQGRSPNLRNAVKAIHDIYGKEVCKTLFHSNPSRLIAGEDLLDVQPRKKHDKKKDSTNWLSKLKLFNSNITPR